MNAAEARRLVQLGVQRGLLKYPGLHTAPPPIESESDTYAKRAARKGMTPAEYSSWRRQRRDELRAGGERKATGWEAGARTRRAGWGERKLERLLAGK